MNILAGSDVYFRKMRSNMHTHVYVGGAKGQQVSLLSKWESNHNGNLHGLETSEMLRDALLTG